MEFTEWITKKMQDIGYSRSHVHNDADLTTWINFTDGTEDFNVCYVKKPIETDVIRDLFEHNSNKPILFIVDIELLTSLTSDAPMWIRALHAIYYGRVYCWNTQGIKAMHFDWSNSTLHSSEYIEIDGILFTDTDCKLRDFPGVFHIARFYDRAFWKEQEPQKPKSETWKERAKKGREEWEQATKGHAQGKSNHRNTEEDIREAFARTFREHMRSHGVNYDEPRPQYPPSGIARDKWFLQLYDTGNLADARALYKQLAKDWHPDLNPGKPQAHETMQAINIAYDKVKAILR